MLSFQKLNRSLACLLAISWWVATSCLSTGDESTSIANPAPDGTRQFTPQQLEFFEREVRPLLVEHCYECHSSGAEKLQAGLTVDSRGGLLHGGDSGPAVEPGAPETSLLLEAVRYESYEMPPRGKLDDASINVLERWVSLGAPWPDEQAPGETAASEQFDLQSRRQAHWAWQPIRSPSPPTVGLEAWPRSPIDHFVLSRLESAGLSPALDAEPSALFRRLYFDLIGLPPTAEQVESFLQDEHPDALERAVDRLLDSPHFGERWGRHWLDLVRYAESRGHEFDEDARHAYQYRDYVIRAFNSDVPYDQLVREHLAGDLLDFPRRHPKDGFNESILGTGFWFLGEWVHSPVDIRKDEAERFDNMIDVMSKTFLGVTVACARCHDHKFDAISTADYYALSGFLQSSDYRQVRFETLEHNRTVAEKLADLDASYRQRIDEFLATCLPDPPLEPTEMTDFTSAAADSLDAIPSMVIHYGDINRSDYLQNGFVFGRGPRRLGQWLPPTASPTDDARNRPDSAGQPGSGSRADFRLNAAADEQPEFVATSAPSASSPAPGEDGRVDDQGDQGSLPNDWISMIVMADRWAAVSDPFWHGLKTENERGIQVRSGLADLPRPGRTLRTPAFQLTDGQVHCRVRGQGHVVACVDSHRLVAGPLHGETIQAIAAGSEWVTLKLDRYLGHRIHLEFTPEEDCSLEVVCVLQGSNAEERRYIERCEQEGSERVTDARHWIGQQVNMLDVKRQRQLHDLLRDWSEDRQALREQVRWKSQLAMAMLDGAGEDDRLLIRGNASKPGELVERRFLSAIDGDQPMAIDNGSGRLQLAARINAPENPLTSRVIVNRIWHHLMGRGIVPTPDDFGVLGQSPTHPELLDYLAHEFRVQGQSIKGLIRRIVLSRTYQMSSMVDPAARLKDPKNHLWHHRPPKRLEGEVIRDALLAVAGELDHAAFGEPAPIHLTPFMDGRGRPKESGPLDGDNRRSIYVAVRRNFLSPFMLAFDTPPPFSTMGRRNVSNVPAQALILMNDPFVKQQMQRWAETLLDTQPSTGRGMSRIERRVRHMYLSAYARPPTLREQRLAVSYIEREADTRGVKADAPELWADLAHAMINAKEFIFLR